MQHKRERGKPTGDQKRKKKDVEEREVERERGLNSALQMLFQRKSIGRSENG